MNANSFYESLANVDLFGSRFNFYSDKKRKIYSPIGGILSLTAIIIGFIVFTVLNKDEFSHKNPLSTTSTSKEPYRNIKFLEEKIWVPFRIRDYRQRTFDFKRGVLYPIVYYYQAKRNYTKNALDLTFKILPYRLCNETSMANNTDSFIIDIELDKLYCIEMDDLDMGGGWDTEYINYVEIDLYMCEDGINFDENNTKCSSYEKILEAAGPDNSFFFDLYYPVVHYQPMNKTKPIFVRYDNIFYHLSRYSNKIERLYLQQHLLTDDDGWIFKHEKNTSFWGILSLSGDAYANGDGKDLMDEGSSSRLYSFNIYCYFDVIYYYRHYKKIYIIFSDGIPIINVIYSFLRIIAKSLKDSFSHKKISELLFENVTSKPDKTNESKISLKFCKNIMLEDKKLDISKNHTNLKVNNFLDNSEQNNKENKNDISSIKIMSPSFLDDNNILKKVSFHSESDSINANKNLRKTQKYPQLFDIPNNNINVGNIKDNNNYNGNNNGNSNNNKKININNIGTNLKENNLNNTLSQSCRKNYINKDLFPFKYYLCTIFIKSSNINKRPRFFPYKFMLVYEFMNQLLDISSYLVLHQENQIFKKIFMSSKYKYFVDNIQKVNINDITFDMEILECLKSQKLTILSGTKYS